MQIRPYQEADRPFLRSLYLAARQAAFTWRDTRNYRLEDFDRSTIGEEIWVAEQDGKLIGFVSIYRAEDFIHNLYVDPPAATGRGQCAIACRRADIYLNRLAQVPGAKSQGASVLSQTRLAERLHRW